MRALTWIERPFLIFAFWVAGALLPFARLASRVGVQSRDDALPSREPGRAIAVRVHEAPQNGPDAPVVLWFHGGGLFLGSARGEDVLARYFAARLKATVVSVDYRLTPEYPWPSALDDCEDSARAAATRWPRRPMLVASMSAGGYYAIQLALVLAHAASSDAAPVDVRGHVAIAPMVKAVALLSRTYNCYSDPLHAGRPLHPL